MWPVSVSDGLRDAKETLSRIPKSSRKNRQNYCEGRGDKPFVFVAGFSNQAKAGEQGSAEGGAVFFGLLLIGAAAGLCAYWMARKKG